MLSAAATHGSSSGRANADFDLFGIPLAGRVALGKVTKGTSGLRRAPLGYQSTCNDPHPASPALSKSLIYAIYDNAQCYPEYRIFYDVR